MGQNWQPAAAKDFEVYYSRHYASYIGSKFRKYQLGATLQQLNSSNQILKSRIQLTELLTLPEF